MVSPNIYTLGLALYTIKRMLVAEVIKLLKLLLVMPATNAVSERSFSSLKRIKTYLSTLLNNNT